MSEPTLNRCLRELEACVFGCVVGTLAVVCFFGSAVSARPGDNPPVLPLYHSDPQHLWNRLHEAIFVRVGPDGPAYGRDRLEPLLWPQSKHLLEERSNTQAAAILEEFLNDRGEERLLVQQLR